MIYTHTQVSNGNYYWKESHFGYIMFVCPSTSSWIGWPIYFVATFIFSLLLLGDLFAINLLRCCCCCCCRSCCCVFESVLFIFILFNVFNDKRKSTTTNTTIEWPSTNKQYCTNHDKLNSIYYHFFFIHSFISRLTKQTTTTKSSKVFIKAGR